MHGCVEMILTIPSGHDPGDAHHAQNEVRAFSTRSPFAHVSMLASFAALPFLQASVHREILWAVDLASVEPFVHGELEFLWGCISLYAHACMYMCVCVVCMVTFLGRAIALPTSTRSKLLFVPHLYDVYTRMVQVMEYCMNGDLGAYIKKHGAVS